VIDKSPAGDAITTPRLLLRPTSLGDDERFVEIQSNWNVARMLRLADWPPTEAAMRGWLSEHEIDRRAGAAFRFAVVLEGRVVGCADIDEISDGRGELGYWLDEAVWGRGVASEAARALMDWGFRRLGLLGLDSGCASDNPASAAILARLGFERCGETRLWSKPRGAAITQLRFAREAPRDGPSRTEVT
jgi:[ribosomal protein S5]-alanine N-acetyltransferase